MQGLFEFLGRHGKRVVLLIDEFDILLEHPNFNNPEFFSELRGMSSTTGGLTLVVASNIPIAEMNRHARKSHRLPTIQHIDRLVAAAIE